MCILKYNGLVWICRHKNVSWGWLNGCTDSFIIVIVKVVPNALALKSTIFDKWTREI